jgi:hypothetical protein
LKKFTIPPCLTAAHGHSGPLDRGLAGWPKAAAFGWPMPSRACVVHARNMVTARCMVNAHGVVPEPEQQQGLHLDLLHGSLYKPQHKNLEEGPRMGFSPARQSGWRRPTALRVETSIKLGKELLARSLSCKEAAQILGHALSVTGSRGTKAHRQWWRSSTGSAVEARALAW